MVHCHGGHHDPMADSLPARPPVDDTPERWRLVHREMLQLLALVVIAVGAFVVTRAVAASNRHTSLADAEEWYRRGELAIGGGRTDVAVEAFRRATARNRGNRRYVLALARALTLNNEEASARAALLSLRETAPEDTVVNLELARLAGRQNDVPEALRFYRSALYAPWTADSAESHRRIRLELVRFLLTHANPGQGVAELMTMSADLPDDASSRLEVARLFEQAGDHAHALDQFEQVLRIAPNDADALVGAGTSAFELGDFARARGYLRRAPTDVPDVARTLSVVEYVLSNDPLANHIGALERRRRLLANIAYARQRLTVCLSGRPSGRIDDQDFALQQQLAAFDERNARSGRLEQDTIEAGVDLVDRIARRAVEECGPETSADRALRIIGHRHRGDPS